MSPYVRMCVASRKWGDRSDQVAQSVRPSARSRSSKIRAISQFSQCMHTTPGAPRSATASIVR